MLNYYAHFFGDVGYTVLSRELFAAMANERPDDIAPVNYDPAGTPVALPKEYAPMFKHIPDMKNGKSLAIAYGSDMYKMGGAKRIGYTMWETTKLPEGWVPCLNQLDAVWTLSKWGKKVFEDSGVTVPVSVIPGGVSDIFNPYADPIPEVRQAADFIFLSVFRWEYRKSPEMLVQAFTEEFCNDEKVSLLMLAFNPFTCRADAWELEQYRLLYSSGIKFDPRIQFLPPIKSREIMPHLYCSADAFVLPTKGEGFGLPFIEAMGCGLPTIGTKGSGQSEFMNDENSYPVTVSYTEIADMRPFIHPVVGSEWSVPDKESLKAQMREVYNDPKKAKTKGLKASEYVHDNFEWKHAAKKAWAAVDSV